MSTKCLLQYKYNVINYHKFASIGNTVLLGDSSAFSTRLYQMIVCVVLRQVMVSVFLISVIPS